MFLNSFNYKQKKSFLSMAKAILIADDGTIDDKEEAYLRSICNEMSLGFNDEENLNFNDLQKIFQTNEEIRIVLVELIALAYSNGEYHENEKSYIKNVINRFNLEESIISDIEGIIKTYFEVQGKIISFIDKEAV